MKKSFKKSLAVILATLMLVSVFSVSVFAADYTVTLEAGDYGNEQDLVLTLGPVAKNKRVTLPDITYTRAGYVQDGWATKADGSGTFYDFGANYRVTKNVTLYPSWEVAKSTITYSPGANGVGAEVSEEVEINQVVTIKDAIFTRDGYVQIGWATEDGGNIVYNFAQESDPVTESVTLYPVWEVAVYAAQISADSANFGFACEGYDLPEARIFEIKNIGNATLQYTLPTSSNYFIEIVSGSLALAPNGSLLISVQPKAGLTEGEYLETFTIACDKDVASMTISLKFSVTVHTFGKYVSDNNATYTSNGTKTAKCLNGCGATVSIPDEGSMKIYSADNNTAEGLAAEYIYHRTVRFIAYGSGCDNKELVTGSKRYLPVSWYVNEEYNGDFADGNYEVVFTHTVFGSYTLTINYIEEEYNDDTKEWTATGETDVKTFEYSVGPTAEEEQEIIRPNSILTLLFGIISYLMDMIGLGNIM